MNRVHVEGQFYNMPIYRIGDRMIAPKTMWACQLIAWALDREDITSEQAEHLMEIACELEEFATGEPIESYSIH